MIQYFKVNKIVIFDSVMENEKPILGKGVDRNAETPDQP